MAELGDLALIQTVVHKYIMYMQGPSVLVLVILRFTESHAVYQIRSI